MPAKECRVVESEQKNTFQESSDRKTDALERIEHVGNAELQDEQNGENFVTEFGEISNVHTQTEGWCQNVHDNQSDQFGRATTSD